MSDSDDEVPTRPGLVSARFQQLQPNNSPSTNDEAKTTVKTNVNTTSNSNSVVGSVWNTLYNAAGKVACVAYEKAGQGVEYVKDRYGTTETETTPPLVISEPGLIFGLPAKVATERSSLSEKIKLPAVFVRCIQYLDDYGLDCEGLYRVAGSLKAVQDTKRLFDRSAEDVNLEALKNTDDQVSISTIASLLKLYLRELPEPLIPLEVAEELDMDPDEDAKEVTKEYVWLNLGDKDNLPYLQHLFRYLMLHLHRVAEKSDENKMTANNLALVFAPTLGMHGKVDWIKYWIENASELFDDDQPQDLSWVPQKKVLKKVAMEKDSSEKVAVEAEFKKVDITGKMESGKQDKLRAFAQANPFRPPSPAPSLQSPSGTESKNNEKESRLAAFADSNPFRPPSPSAPAVKFGSTHNPFLTSQTPSQKGPPPPKPPKPDVIKKPPPKPPKPTKLNDPWELVDSQGKNDGYEGFDDAFIPPRPK